MTPLAPAMKIRTAGQPSHSPLRRFPRRLGNSLAVHPSSSWGRGVLRSMVDVADAGQLARHPPGVFTLGELGAATRSPGPAIPPDITAVAAEVRRCGGVSPAWLPAHPALPAAGAQAHHAGRAHRLRYTGWSPRRSRQSGSRGPGVPFARSLLAVIRAAAGLR
jgi:hypothetical protein